MTSQTKRDIIISLSALFLLVILILVTNTFRPDSREKEAGLTVQASFYPLYFLTERLGGERLEVNLLVPAGAEPHDYELSARDWARIADSDLVVLNGGGLEAWQKNLEKNFASSGPEILIVGEGLMNLQSDYNNHDEEEADYNDEELAYDGQELDPHIWLDPRLLGGMAERIATALIKLDPSGQDYYQERLAFLWADLNTLDEEYRRVLSACSRRQIIVSHAAFAYLALAYDLEMVAITGLSPEAEPSPRALAELADFARTREISYIFFEELASPKLAAALASEVGAQTLVLNPLESLSKDDLAVGEDYFTKMRENLNNLRIALDCSS